MSLDIVSAFVTGLFWYEIAIILVLLVGGFIAFTEESVGGLVILIAILILPSWPMFGSSLYSLLSFSDIIIYFAGYLIVGLFWSRFKWKLLVQNIIKRYHKTMSKNEVKYEITTRKSYDAIGYWVLFWPFNSFGYFFNEWIIDLVKKIVKKMSIMYDKITDNELNNSNVDFVKSTY